MFASAMAKPKLPTEDARIASATPAALLRHIRNQNEGEWRHDIALK